MGDVGEYWRDAKDFAKERRAQFGVPCPRCQELLPRSHPKILLPGDRCKMHKYTDPRSRSIMTQDSSDAPT